jgi:hypothetical protein
MRDDLYTMDLNATGQNAASRVQYRSELIVGTVVQLLGEDLEDAGRRVDESTTET